MAAPLHEVLLPELEAELTKTRRILAALPDADHDFKPHDKSMSFAKLAGHLAELPGFAAIMLTTPSLDLTAPGSPRRPIVMESREQLLSAFDANAAKLVDALKSTSDDRFAEVWKLSRGEMSIFDGTRYNAYRTFGVNHMVHHRAQLGTYIRLLNHPLPGTYGPSADGM